jgi:hypothetical protein
VNLRLTGLLSTAIAMLALSIGAPAAARWAPPQQLSWYWQLTGNVNNSYPAAAYDIDGFDNGASEVSALHAARKHVICYIDVGTWENWRADAIKFPSSVLGNNNGWPGERWLDVRQLSVLEPIMTARFQMCKQKGFDAIEPDNMDGWENDTGFPISSQDQLRYNQWVAKEAHALGLAVLQKNDPEQAAALEPYFDGVLDEQCNEYSECSSFRPYLNAGKPVLNAEYNLQPGQFCSADNSAGIMGALYSINLDGSEYQPCWSGSPGFGGPAPASHHGIGKGAPSVAIGAAPLAARHGAVRVRLSCPRGETYCQGSVVLAAARGGLVLGRSRFRIRGGHGAAVRIRLSRVALAKLGRPRSLRVLVRVSAHDKLGRRLAGRRTVRLRLVGGH